MSKILINFQWDQLQWGLQIYVWYKNIMSDKLPTISKTSTRYSVLVSQWISIQPGSQLSLMKRHQNPGSLSFFYCAMLCIRGTSHGPVSVSVTSRSSTKTAKRRITQTTPHDSLGTLVFWYQRSPRNSTGVTPYGGVKCRWGGSKSAIFD